MPPSVVFINTMSIMSDRDPRGEGRWNHVLLAFLLLLLMLQPGTFVAEGILVRLAFAAVLVACISAVASQTRLLIVGLLLGGPALVLLFMPGSGPFALSVAFAIATLVFICAVMLTRIFNRRAVTSASISAALSVYMMLGVIWSHAYRLVEYFRPGSFNGLSGSSLAEVNEELFYYSYVTLSTLGYGDISPESEIARSLAITEAIIGQLYLVVLVAGLVGMRLAHKQNPGDSTSRAPTISEDR